jgi:hypothetical protein
MKSEAAVQSGGPGSKREDISAIPSMMRLRRGFSPNLKLEQVATDTLLRLHRAAGLGFFSNPAKTNCVHQFASQPARDALTRLASRNSTP